MASSTNLSVLLKVISDNGQAAISSAGDQQAEAALLASAQKLVSMLESPVERLSKMVYLEPTLLSIVRSAIDWNLYSALMANDGLPKTADQLAAACSVDEVFMARSLKHLAAGRIIAETDVNTYEPTPIVSLLCDPRAAGMVIDMCVVPQIVSQLPYYLKDRGCKNPTNKDDSPFMYSYDTKLHYFEWLAQPGMEERQKALGRHMSFKDLGKQWFEPSNTNVQEILGNSTDASEVLMVDIGGSIGHDLIGFHKAHPDIPGRLILQDLPAQIEKIDRSTFPPYIEAMAYDFFTPQPIRGAKAYYLHQVLHDWPDETCEKILSTIMPAMKKGHSKILLNEFLIPDKGASWYGTSLDILMMLVHAAQERTETDWRRIIEKVGLKVTKIWDCSGAPSKIIELELA